MAPVFGCKAYGPIAQFVTSTAIIWTGYSIYMLSQKIKEKKQKEVVDENTEAEE